MNCLLICNVIFNVIISITDINIEKVNFLMILVEFIMKKYEIIIFIFVLIIMN